MVKLNKIDKMILATLKLEGKELSLEEIAIKVDESPKKTFKSLRKLFENEYIDTKARKYKIIDNQK